MHTKKHVTHCNDGHSDIPPRYGKTKKDRESGKSRRTIGNRQARADWQNSECGGGRTMVSFPWASCNGKRNRFDFGHRVRHSNPAAGANYRSKKTHNARIGK